MICEWGAGGKAANVAFVAVLGVTPMHGMIFVVPGRHLTERKCQKDEQVEEMDSNTVFECDFGFCFDASQIQRKWV